VITPVKGEFLLERDVVVSRGIQDVFRFFSDPANLNRLTPPWLDFHIVGCSTPTIGAGTLIDYKLKVRGFPLRWRSRILAWNPPYGFADEQVRGPYRSWLHHHSFEDLGGRTRCRDLVRYSVLGGRIVDRLFVRRDVERIFDHRGEQLAKIFGG
jgi:ligand-binding SRPBCC domain-containing protein